MNYIWKNLPLVKILRTIACLAFIFFTSMSYAAVTPPVPSPRFDVSKIKIKDIERITGKKLTLIEKIKFKLAQKIAKKYVDGEISPKQKRQARAAMILGIVGFGLLFVSLIPFVGFLGILSIPFAILAIILGSNSLKGNSNKEGKVGLVAGIVTLSVIILAVILVAIAFSGFTFE